MLALKLLFWMSGGALLWTHALYPLAAAGLARVRTRRVRQEPIEPNVTVIVAAYNEEAVIERRLENLLALEYPSEKLELVVTSDASSDRTHELVERFEPRVRLIV
ncbi:MAG TPA: glycosyltransferase, partial [Gaiellaceae bacterium]|nr:glycosyltransferase [Gaiellaceae bacterium]